MRSIRKGIRFPKQLIQDYQKISKISNVPYAKLIAIAMRKELLKLKVKYPDYKYVTLRDGGRDERI